MDELVGGFGAASLLREGAVAVLAGRANVGKSTLFNAILRQERSIVDEKPGTTRDYIAETIELEGIPLTLVDTAGLRHSGETVEIEGMRRAARRMHEADLVLLITEAGVEFDDDERNILQQLREKPIETVVVRNKTDALPRGAGALPASGKEFPVSALHSKGIRRLLTGIKDCLRLEEITADKGMITEMRQQQLFREAARKIREAHTLVVQDAYDEVVLEELNAAMTELHEITGRGGREEVLRRIFSQFCIGK
jgi:tRNA modification GTPase